MRKAIFNTIKSISFLMLVIVFISCGNVNTNNSIESKVEDRLIDTSTFVIISFDSSRNFPFNNKCKQADLTKNEIENIDSVLKKCVEDYNSLYQGENETYFKIDLINEQYKRQYVPIVNEKGEKEVWVNCFCHSFDDDWKKNILIVDDGGSCFFNFKINLVTKKCYEFYVNGLA